MMRELAETGMRASPGDLGRNQAQLFYLARFADRAAFLSLGNIISATSSTLVFLRYSNCFDCCATHRHLGGHGPCSAQWPKPKEQWHSTTGSSKATHRSYRETCSTGRTNRTPPPTPRWVFTSFFRANALTTLLSVGREMPVSSTSSGICMHSSGPSRPMSPMQTAAIATCREIIQTFQHHCGRFAQHRLRRIRAIGGVSTQTSGRSRLSQTFKADILFVFRASMVAVTFRSHEDGRRVYPRKGSKS